MACFCSSQCPFRIDLNLKRFLKNLYVNVMRNFMDENLKKRLSFFFNLFSHLFILRLLASEFNFNWVSKKQFSDTQNIYEKNCWKILKKSVMESKLGYFLFTKLLSRTSFFPSITSDPHSIMMNDALVGNQKE